MPASVTIALLTAALAFPGPEGRVPLLDRPLPVNQTTGYHPPAYRLAAEGDVLWVASAQGLRRYDLQAWTLSRPPALPAGDCTAVLVHQGRIWTAIDGKLYRRDRAGTWAAPSHPAWGAVRALSLAGETLWVAASQGLFALEPSGRVARHALALRGKPLDDVRLVSSGGGVVWVSACQAEDGPVCALARFAAGRWTIHGQDEASQPIRPWLLAAQPDGTVRVSLSDDRAGPVDGAFFVSFDGTRWTALPPPPGATRFLGAADGSTIWADVPSGVHVLGPRGGWRTASPASPLQGLILGATETAAGLWVLDGHRLHLWRGGRWTLWTMPRDGASAEKDEPDPPQGFHHATGRAFRPGAAPVLPLAGVEGVPVPRWRRAARVGGVPVLESGDGRGELGLVRGCSSSDWWAYRPEFGPDDRFTIEGIYTDDAEFSLFGPPHVDSVSAPQCRVDLLQPLRGEGAGAPTLPQGALVSFEARPVVAQTHARQGSLDVVFEPVGPVRVHATARELVERFHAAHRLELDVRHPHPEHPRFWTSYDAPRRKVVFRTVVPGFWQRWLAYETSLDGKLEAVYRWDELRGE